MGMRCLLFEGVIKKMKVDFISKQLEEKFPSYIQEEYDNTGQQILFPDEEIKGVYICLDADTKTIEDARLNDCNLIISHHPMLFKPVKKINYLDSKSKSIIKLIDNRISLYSLHTNFDKIIYPYLSDITGYTGGELLLKKGLLNSEDIGFGSFVKLSKATTFQSVLDNIKEKLKLDYIIYSGEISDNVNSIAFINGAGGGSIEKIIDSLHPDCIVTGDVGYHSVKYAIDNNVFIIDAGHFGTENILKKLLAESVNDIISVNENSIRIIISDVEKNPFSVY